MLCLSGTSSGQQANAVSTCKSSSTLGEFELMIRRFSAIFIKGSRSVKLVMKIARIVCMEVCNDWAHMNSVDASCEIVDGEAVSSVKDIVISTIPEAAAPQEYDNAVDEKEYAEDFY